MLGRLCHLISRPLILCASPLCLQNYQQLLQQYQGKILPKVHPATMAIEKIGSRIFKAAGEFAREYNLDYFDTKNVTFTVVDTDQANAFVLPGNHVFCK